MENSYLSSALSLAKLGFHVFPLVPGEKIPRKEMKDYTNKATRDELTIFDWWTQWPHSNIGISTTKFGTDEALLVIDVDTKESKNGNKTLIKLELEGKKFPETHTQITPSGGRHFIYRVSKPVKQGTNVFGPGVDVRANGGYIVGAGSDIGGKKYVSEIREIAFAPDWAVATCGIPNEKTTTKKTDTSVIDKIKAADRSREYLKNAPVAVEGESGDQTTFAVACKLKDFGLNSSEVFSLLTEPGGWNDQCSPPWSPHDLQMKIRNAFAYGLNPVGVATAELQFKNVDTQNSGEEFYLERINKEYALIYMEGNHFILHETVDEKGASRRVFLTEASFKRRFSPYTVQSGRGRTNSWAEEWLDWSGRREYAGVCFTPERAPRHNYYNLWRGFTTLPKKYEDAPESARAGFNAFMDHALKNVCGNDQGLFLWLMGYFAHMIQRPFDRPLTTLVFRGLKGTGKNALIDRIGKLLGNSHYLVAHDSRYLTSNFNGHLDSCLCLVLDEAFWSGDKSAEGKLKGLTTAPEILIERKGKEPYTVDNLVRLVVIGNEDWLVPASFDERRYAVFDVGNGRRKDNRFFENMRVNMDEKGGNSVLLDYLQKFDLSKIEVNEAPSTAALYEQKIASQEPMFDWWFECLTEGRIVGSDFNEGWSEVVDKNSFRQAFMRYTKDRNIKGRLPTSHSFGKMVSRCCPSTKLNSCRREGEKTISTYVFPSLAVARSEWDSVIGHKTRWSSS